MSSITDREFLAITNFCNMKLEFANVKKVVGGRETNENHTIFSLLEQELESILKNEIRSRVFFDLVNEDNLELKNLR